jgi:hypothetical protein
MAIGVTKKTMHRPSVDVPWPPISPEEDAYIQTKYIDTGIIAENKLTESADGLSRTRTRVYHVDNIDQGNSIQQLLRADDVLYQYYLEKCVHCEEHNITIGALEGKLYDNEYNLIFFQAIPNDLLF